MSSPSPVFAFSIAHGCLLMAAVLPLLCSWIAKWGQLRTSPGRGGFDNADPRGWLARQGGWRARANAAQANSFEALPFFFAAVLLATMLGAPQAWLDGLALLYLLLRLGYIAAYVGDKPSTRSALWALAFVVNIAIFLLGWR